MTIFKGKPDVFIACQELPSLNSMSFYACQEAAWMDKWCMLTWVKEVLGAYLATNPVPNGMQPVLLLDLYQCHMMAPVLSKIEEMGILVIHIPGAGWLHSSRATVICGSSE